MTSQIFNRSSQFTHIQTIVKKLHQRGYLVTLYQNIERVMEIEKENDKIESFMKNSKRNWKDCFDLSKNNFAIIDDLYESMIK